MNNKETLVDKILRLKNRQNEINYFLNHYDEINKNNYITSQEIIIHVEAVRKDHLIKLPLNKLDLKEIIEKFEQELIQINKELDFINTVEIKV